MDPCPRNECNGTLIVETFKRGSEITCRACGRHPRSPVVTPPTQPLTLDYKSSSENRDRARPLGKRKASKLKKGNH